MSRRATRRLTLFATYLPLTRAPGATLPLLSSHPAASEHLPSKRYGTFRILLLLSGGPLLVVPYRLFPTLDLAFRISKRTVHAYRPTDLPTYSQTYLACELFPQSSPTGPPLAVFCSAAQYYRREHDLCDPFQPTIPNRDQLPFFVREDKRSELPPCKVGSYGNLLAPHLAHWAAGNRYLITSTCAYHFTFWVPRQRLVLV